MVVILEKGARQFRRLPFFLDKNLNTERLVTPFQNIKDTVVRSMYLYKMIFYAGKIALL